MSIRTTNLFFIIIFLFLGVQCKSEKSKEAKNPNMIFIVCDDLNDDVFGASGFPHANTPNIDRLKDMGVTFTHAYDNAPLCGPSRASFLTGLYPHTSGFYSDKNNWRHMRYSPVIKDAQTIMEHFWNQGYDVYGTGKIYHNLDHEDRVWKLQDGTPTYGEPIDWGPWPWDGKGKTGFSGPLHPSLPKTMCVDNTFASLADVPDIPANPKTGAPGYKGWILHNKPFRYVSETDRDLMPDEKNAKYAVETIKAEHKNPYLLCVGFNRPHTPLIVPQKYIDRYPIDSVNLPDIKENDLADVAKVFSTYEHGYTANSPHGMANYRGVINGGGKELLRKWIQHYLAAISFVDDQLGDILDALKNSPDKDNTYIVFVSDNGYHMGTKETLYKFTLWEEAGRIPFIVAGAGLAKGAKCSKPISLIDIFPTMNDLCEISNNPNEKTNGVPLDGHSLKPLLKNPENGKWNGPDVALTVVANGNKNPTAGEITPEKHHYSVRSERYRYILCNDGEEELYDHKADPMEWTNIAANPEVQEIKATLKKELKELTKNHFVAK
jgi:arylsulfatase A-like enzyme